MIEAIVAGTAKMFEIGKEVATMSQELPKFAKDIQPMEIKSFSDADQPLREIDNKYSTEQKELLEKSTNETESNDIKSPIQNKIDGLKREEDVLNELKEQYPEEKGYGIESEVYLRDENGKIVKDPVTGEARRVDFVITENGEVIDSIEVTSKTADKAEQTAKEDRIREHGGNYVKDSRGNLIEISDDVKTRIERRE